MWKALYKPECKENDFVNAENNAEKKKKKKKKLLKLKLFFFFLKNF